jgi:hypothetical protein
MRTSSYDSAVEIRPQTVQVPAGVTNALFYGMEASQIDVHVKAMSASNLIVLQAGANGSTMPGATLAALFTAGSYYVLGAAQFLDFDGPVSFYLAAIGATAQASIYKSYNVFSGT